MVSNLNTSQSVVVVDYGSGNLRSVAQALRAVADAHTTVIISNDPAAIHNAHRVVLPGQGAMHDCMKHLRASGLLDAVLKAAQGPSAKPLMGVCVGQQMLLDGSTESIDGSDFTPALGLIAGKVVRFASNLKDAQGERLKVPHMGWNQVFHGDKGAPSHPVFKGIAEGERFYFVHSYYAQPTHAAHVLATTDYGVQACVAVGRDNLIGLQFHPEKSAAAGLALYKNFLNWTV
jgi:imidazole glycerol-phosphate synthase subunit HisH